jgi:hypothetical protein
MENLPNVLKSVNSRELAIFCWLLVLLIWIVFSPSIRKTIHPVVKSIFQTKLTAYFAAISIYTFLAAWLLHRLGLWDWGQLKNTILWYFTVGAVSLSDIVDPKKNNYFKDTIKDVLSLTAILQFIVGAFTFSLWIEIFLVPVVTLIGALIAFAKHKKEYGVSSLLTNLLAFAGLAYILHVIFQLATNFTVFANKETLFDFVVPALFSFLFLPFLYLLSIIVTHDDTFIYLQRKLTNPSVYRYARWKALLHFHANKTDLARWKQIVLQETRWTREEVEQSIRLLKASKKAELNPPSVPFDKGWSPYEAKDFLLSVDIATEYYKPVYEEDWMASSPYIRLESEALITDTLAYYVEGIQTTATKLTLSLQVHDKKHCGLSVAKFMEAANLLYEKAIRKPTPKGLDKMIIAGKYAEIREGNRVVEITRNEWQGTKTSGFHLSMCITVKE